MGKSQKTYMSIRSKLMAAVAMLLVASFMVVSSTYAWFTLSTAPEITGVRTSVGANGNLEIALIDTDSATLDLAALAANIQTTTGGLVDLTEINKTWGNIVELSNADNENPYGLKDITLLPSRLSLIGADTLDSARPLSVPSYGADGRMTALKSDNTVHGTWTGTGFAIGGTGVRALGTIASMTQAELDYRSARLAYASAINNAFNLANDTLQNNKQGLVNTAMSVAMGTTEEYDITTLRTMINALYPTDGSKGVVEYLEEARKNIIKALYIVATSTETTYTSPTNVTFAEDGTPSVVTAVATVEVPGWANLSTTNAPVMKDYNGLVAKIESIGDALSAANSKLLTATGTVDETTIKEILKPLFNTSSVKIGATGTPVGELRQALTDAGFTSITQDPAAVLTWMKDNGYIGEDNMVDAQMGDGSGVFADINQATGRAISATADFMIVFKVRMHTVVTETYDVTYATNEGTSGTDILYPQAPEGGAEKSSDLTDYYGYALDFAFRTNAKESNLMLQTTATNRIYSEGGSEDTMGSGSTMRFKSSDTVNFTEADVANLMSSIRIVFVNDADEIIAVAGAKTETVTEGSGENETTVNKVVYRSEVEGNDTYVVADIVLYNYTIDFADDPATDDIDESKTPGKITLNGIKTSEDGATELMPLVQNTATALSAYVYLDGDDVENGDVAAEATSSMVGSINLQFSSDADLKPMEYSELMNPSQNTENQTPAQGGEAGN